MAFSNTETLTTNLNVSPYFDDFDESKNFHRILFRPGFGVQARELTQLQSILQNQIDRFGEHIFRDGSIVSGCEFAYENPVSYVKLTDNNVGNTASVNVTSFVGQTVTGGTNGVEANVFFVVTGSEAEDPNLKTLYVKYTRSSANGRGRYFIAGEQLTTNTGLSAIVANTTQSLAPVGFGSVFTVGEGVVFGKDHFVRVPQQTIVVGRYTLDSNTNVGLNLNESIVTPNEDATLTDPASGSFNFAAPGAARLKIDPVLATTTTANTSGFIRLAQIEKGRLVTYTDKPKYAEIRDYLAQRTFDESGNYTVRGFNVRLREHLRTANNNGVFLATDGGQANSLSVDADPGKAFVRGFDVETLRTTHTRIDKGIDFEDVEDVIITNQYGNYVTVNEVSGTWDINLHDTVNILSVPFNSVSNGDYSVSQQGGRAQIGTARVRSITKESGNPGEPEAQYRLYLYDVQMTNGEFSSARSFFYQSASDADGKADAVLTGGDASIEQGAFKKAVYPVGFGAIRRVKDENGASDTDYEFMRAFNSLTIANTGIVTASSPNPDELFPFTAGSTVASPNERFYLVFDASANTVALEGTVTRSSGTANTLTRASGSTNFTAYINEGDVLKVAGHSNTFTVSGVSATTINILEDGGAAITNKPFFKEFPVGKVIDLEGKGQGAGGTATAPTAGADRAVTIGTPATSATIDIKEPLNSAVGVSLLTSLNKSNATEITKNLKIKRRVQINTATNSGGTTGPWCLGFSDVYQIRSVRKRGSNFSTLSQGEDVTSEFELDNGQRDGFYGLASLRLKSTSALSISSGDRLLVSLDYFEHDRSSGEGFLTVDSYPVNDTGSQSNTQIRTENIPLYISPTDLQEIDLRDAIDFRPVVESTANDTTQVVGSSLNPANTSVIDSTNITSGQGLRFPRPNENTTVDLSFFEGRNDLIVVTASGDVRSVRGVPSNNPQFPTQPEDAMIIGKVRVSPFPSLPSEQAKNVNRPDLQSTIEPVKNKRFTMKDIGSLASRIDRLEYYTSLNLLEKSAADLFISDDVGNDRFKNGILVDKFSGHGVGDTKNLDYSISINRATSEARPQFKNREVQVAYNSGSSTNTSIRPRDVRLEVTSGKTFSNGETITAGAASGKLAFQTGNRLYIENSTGTFAVSSTATGGSSGQTATINTVQEQPNGKAVTLQYQHLQFGEQPYATTQRSLAGLAYRHVGRIILDPDQDYWIDTTRNPDVAVNFDLQNDNFLNTINPYETDYAFDETLVFGSTNFVTGTTLTNNVSGTKNKLKLTTEQQTVQNGLNLSIGQDTQVVPFSDTQSIGERVVDVNIVPFMRPRLIKVTGFGFKPRTRLYAYFDAERVTQYVTPMNSTFTANTGTEGSPLITDNNGQVFAEFRLPNNDSVKFRTGQRRFRLSDSSTNSDRIGVVTTSGEATYTAEGLSKTVQSTIVSIQAPEIIQDLEVNAEAYTDVIDSGSSSSEVIVNSSVISNDNTPSGGPNPVNDPSSSGGDGGGDGGGDHGDGGGDGGGVCGPGGGGNTVTDSDGDPVTSSDGSNVTSSGGGGGGDGGGKIVCTAMNNAYGFGSFRQTVWLKHSASMTKEHEIGYHTIFMPLVKYAYHTEKFGYKKVRAVLEHIARHRTADIWKQNRGKRDLIGAVERAILEPICYVVGKYKLRNKG